MGVMHFSGHCALALEREQGVILQIQLYSLFCPEPHWGQVWAPSVLRLGVWGEKARGQVKG